MKISIRYVCAVVYFVALPAMGQSFDQITRPVATLTEKEVMEEILRDLLILTPTELTSIQMVDITSNGFGPDDLLILNPTLEVHYIGDYIPPSLRTLISEWTFDADYQTNVIREVTDDKLLNAHLEEDAAATIAASCMNAIDTHYIGDDMNILLARNDGTVKVELWGYQPEYLLYGGASDGASCEINRQRFKFARPIQVTAFKDPSTCVETWTENGRMMTSTCNP